MTESDCHRCETFGVVAEPFSQLANLSVKILLRPRRTDLDQVRLVVVLGSCRSCCSCRRVANCSSVWSSCAGRTWSPDFGVRWNNWKINWKTNWSEWFLKLELLFNNLRWRFDFAVHKRILRSHSWKTWLSFFLFFE